MKALIVLTSAMMAVTLTGCATFGRPATRMNDVSIGMTKAEVIQAVGGPTSSSATGGYEYLTYSFYEVTFGPYVPYFVRLHEGKVDAYGRKGDFDSTKMPNQSIDVNIKSAASP